MTVKIIWEHSVGFGDHMGTGLRSYGNIDFMCEIKSTVLCGDHMGRSHDG